MNCPHLPQWSRASRVPVSLRRLGNGTHYGCLGRQVRSVCCIVPVFISCTGYSLDEQSVPEDELAPYIQQAIDQINFVIGDPSTSKPAALRASLGHPEPFPLQYIEIGNEDFFASES